MKYIVDDHDPRGYSKYGVFFYGEQILFGWSENFGTRSYQFKLKVIGYEGKRDRVDAYLKGDKYIENLTFIHTCDLKDYVKSYTLPAWMLDEGEDGVNYTLDLDKLVADVCPKELKYLKARLERKVKGIIPDPVVYTEGKWHENEEFLVFTKETAYSWGGPFTQDGKLGACAEISNKKYIEGVGVKEVDDITIPIINVKQQYGYWDLSYDLQKKIDDHLGGEEQKGDEFLFNASSEEREKFFNESFAVSEKHEIFKHVLGHWNKECVESLLPWKVRLAGNDDYSYTKWFTTKEEADEEMNYLRMMQPLDMSRDIYDRGYIFTN